MTKQEFLTQLQRNLNGRIGSKKAAEHIAYYQEYIEIELRKGRPLQEIMEDLGSPGLIARSITDAHKRKEEKESSNKGFSKYRDWIKGLCTRLGQETFEKMREWFNGL